MRHFQILFPLWCICLHAKAQTAFSAPSWKPKSRPAKQDSKIIAKEGSTIKMSCPTNGNPLPIIQWYKDGRIFNVKKRLMAVTKKRGYSLILKNVSHLDNGDYQCVVTNGFGSLSFTFNVEVTTLNWPLKLEEPKNITVTEGEDANFTCRALNDPTAHVQWLKHVKENVLKTDTKEELVLRNVTMQDAGPYICLAANIYGFKNVKIWLNVIPHSTTTTTTNTTFTAKVPGQPRNLHAKMLSPNEIEVIWSHPENATIITSYELYYSDSTSESFIRLFPYYPTTKWIINNLKPDTMYNINVSAASEYGTGPSATIRIETDWPPIPGQPQNLHAKVLSPTKIKVIWSHPEDSAGVMTYELYYNDSSSERHVRVYPPSTQYIIKNLKPDAIYNIRVTAGSEKGTGPSATYTIRTASTLPGSPRDLHANVLSPNKIEVTWSPPTGYTDGITSYIVYYGDDSLGDYRSVHVQAPATKYIIHDLKPNTTYFIRVSASSTNGIGPMSATLLKKTESVSRCPHGGIEHGSMCYYFSRKSATSWAEANSYCLAFGYKLAEPEQDKEVNFIKETLKGMPRSDRYFLGASSIFAEGEWIWSSSKTKINPHSWEPSKPNNDTDTGDCLAVNHDGAWKAIPCSNPGFFICQAN